MINVITGSILCILSGTAGPIPAFSVQESTREATNDARVFTIILDQAETVSPSHPAVEAVRSLCYREGVVPGNIEVRPYGKGLFAHRVTVSIKEMGDKRRPAFEPIRRLSAEQVGNEFHFTVEIDYPTARDRTSIEQMLSSLAFSLNHEAMINITYPRVPIAALSTPPHR